MKICAHRDCQKEFDPNSGNQKYCCSYCARAENRKKLKDVPPDEYRVCMECGKEFPVWHTVERTRSRPQSFAVGIVLQKTLVGQYMGGRVKWVWRKNRISTGKLDVINGLRLGVP